MALYADVHPPTLYESTGGCMNRSCSDINSTAPGELLEANTSYPHFLSTTVATLTVPASSLIPSITTVTDLTNFATGATLETASEVLTERKDELENKLPAKQCAGDQQYTIFKGNQTLRRMTQLVYLCTVCY